MTIKAICMHNHMSHNRKTLCVAGNSWLPVDVDNREKFSVLMGQSRLGLMDIHNFFNPYVFEVRDSAIVTIQHL